MHDYIIAGEEQNKTEIRNEASEFNKKWRIPDGKYSFTQIPNMLIYCQEHLELKDRELITLIQLLAHWFTSDSNVFPSIMRLADFSGKKYSTVQRNLKALEKKGFIRRRAVIGRPNFYDFVPCVEKLERHAGVCPISLNIKNL
jgi:predicted transcriptional regulator